MCLLLVAYKTNPNYKLIVAANRDEFYDRPAKPAHFWDEHPSLLAGKDLEAGGTWMGITREGNFAGITNYRDMSAIKKDAPTRGELVTNFLLNNHDPLEFGKFLQNSSGAYNGFNLIFGNDEGLYYFSNQTNKLIKLTPGIYGLSNHLLDTPWFKVKKSKASFSKIINEENVSPEDLLTILSDKEKPPDDLLPNTGLQLEIERAVSPVFVSTPKYGTRSSAVIFRDLNDKITFIEKSLNVFEKKWENNSFRFLVKKN